MSIGRRTLQVVAFICTLVVGTAAMAVIVTQTTWFKEWLRGFIVRQAEDYVNGRLSIGRLDGNLFFGVELEDVDVTMNGKTVVDVKDLGVDYNVLSFIGGGVVLDHIRLNQPVLLVERTRDGWNLAQLIKARTPDPDEPKNRRPIEIGEIGVSDGTLLFQGDVAGTSGIVETPTRIDRLDASVGVRSDEDELRVDINHVSLRAAAPRFGVNGLSGTVRRSQSTLYLDGLAFRTEESSIEVSGSVQNIEGGTPVVDVRATSDKLDTEEIARLVPALRGYRLQPAFEISAKGRADRMAVAVSLRDGRVGDIRADLTVDSEAPGRRVAGTAEVRRVDVGPLAKNGAFRSDITGRVRFDFAMPEGRLPISGTYAVVAPSVHVAGFSASDVRANGRIDGRVIRVSASATAYGGRVTSAGTIRTGHTLALHLDGRATGLDLRNLPAQLNAPRVPSNLQFTYRVSGRRQVYSGDVRMAQSTLAGATIGEGTVATFRVGGKAPHYSAQGHVAHLDLQQVGRGFGLPALSADRYRSDITATFDVNGTGGGRYPLTLDATGVVTDSQVFGASFPRLNFRTNLAGAGVRLQAVGQFQHLDPSAISGNERLAGDLSGAVDVTATVRDYRGPIGPEDIDASGRINLANSHLAGFDINTAAVDGSLTGREGRITQLSVVGPDIKVQASGPIALNDTGASSLVLHLETPALDRIGQLIDQPLKGGAVIDATVTGNAGKLAAQGTVKGSNIGHGNNEALSLETSFDVAVPNLTPGDVAVKAKSHATFLQVGGQTINELTADTTYSMDTVTFDALAKQGVRELQAGGSVVLHPDHQEVHVRNLALRAENLQWTTTPGSEATVQYGPNRVQVDNLTLVSGDQRITANGAFGSRAESLRVQVENVDVAQIDALMLGDQRIGGRLSADAVVSGTRDAPAVAGEFSLAPGSFRAFQFESLAGTLDYAGQGMTLDVRLQQNPQAWLTAKGFAPLTLFRANPPERVGQHDVPAPGEAVDIEIASSEIDLGVIQGFTSYVTDVTGTVEANVRVTGSGFDPHVDGVVEVRSGAFNVPELGTAYTGLDTRIDLKSDQLSITEMKVIDENGQPMTIGGTLGVHERAVGAVDVTMRSNDFEVIDNDTARLHLTTDMRLTGEVRAPRLEGAVDIHTGTINVAELLMQFTSGAYSTTATVITPEQSANPATVPPPPGVLDSLNMNLAIGIPGNLVLNGRDMRPANAPIEIGDMNVTVGGALQLRKAPGDRFRILGEVNTVRGSYTFQGRRFDLERDGRIRFQGSDELDPLIDLRASRTISGVQTTVNIRGTMRQPELSFASNPPLEQAEILSLIIFNQPINELGEGQQVSLAQRASALAGGYLASGLSTSIANALNIDEFEIQAAGEEGGGPQLTVGEQIGNNLFFRLRQAFGAAQTTELILEYRIREFLRLQATAAEAQSDTQRVTFRRVERGGLDLLFFFSY